MLDAWFDGKISHDFLRCCIYFYGLQSIVWPWFIKSHKILTKQINSLTLTYDHVTWTSVWVIYTLDASTVPSLGTFQWRVKKNIEWTTFFQDQKFDLDLWPCDLNIKSIWIIFSLGASSYKILQLSSKGVKRYWAEITWTTDRPTGAKHSKGAKNTKNIPCGGNVIFSTSMTRDSRVLTLQSWEGRVVILFSDKSNNRKLFSPQRDGETCFNLFPEISFILSTYSFTQI